MFLTMMKAKIHRATVTQCDLHYVGSITLPKDMMERSGILPNELVHVVNINNGARLETYTIAGEEKKYCLNGAAARLAQPGDQIIVIAYGMMDEREAREHVPTVLCLDDDNEILEEK